MRMQEEAKEKYDADILGWCPLSDDDEHECVLGRNRANTDYRNSVVFPLEKL